jgi:hypothetical protein
MLFTRPLKRVISGVVIGGLLFAQAAFAMQPCDSNMSAAGAMLASQQDDCCKQSVKEVSLCVAQCTDSSKVTGLEPPNIVAIYLGAALSLPGLDSDANLSHRARPDLVADPPPNLRFCRLLI